jgi:hypothetical protein
MALCRVEEQNGHQEEFGRLVGVARVRPFLRVTMPSPSSPPLEVFLELLYEVARHALHLL